MRRRVTRPRRNTKQERDCPKCGGSGHIARFGHYAQGVCFECGGTGVPRQWSGRGKALPPEKPASTEELIESDVMALRTMWHNYSIHRREGALDEMWFGWSNMRFDREWDMFRYGERKTEPAPASAADGKREWLRTAQFYIDDLRKLGAGAKAKEIAEQFQSKLRVPLKNVRRRTSRRIR